MLSNLRSARLSYQSSWVIANASHHRQQKAERGTSGTFCCPSACDCYADIF